MMLNNTGAYMQDKISLHMRFHKRATKKHTDIPAYVKHKPRMNHARGEPPNPGASQAKNAIIPCLQGLAVTSISHRDSLTPRCP